VTPSTFRVFIQHKQLINSNTVVAATYTYAICQAKTTAKKSINYFTKPENDWER